MMKSMTHPEAASLSPRRLVTRRGLVEMAGVTLVGTVVLATTGCTSAIAGMAAPMFPHVDIGPVAPRTVAGVPIGALNGGSKPIYVAPPGSHDPVAHSVADTLFWGEQMMEHAMFFVMLMPGAELAGPRGEAEQLQRQFSNHLSKLRGSRLDRGNYAAFNNTTLGLTNAIAAYKRRMEEEQVSGRMRSLVWPQFFSHTRHEAERFATRLTQLNRGNATFDRREVVPFWADKMEEHALFVSQLLDPSEKSLQGAAQSAAATFDRLEDTPVGSKDPAMAAVQQIINFKTAAEKGIQTGQIKSIIHPALADHVRREAVRFKDELDRAV
jgi:hypothetical protein